MHRVLEEIHDLLAGRQRILRQQDGRRPAPGQGMQGSGRTQLTLGRGRQVPGGQPRRPADVQARARLGRARRQGQITGSGIEAGVQQASAPLFLEHALQALDDLMGKLGGGAATAQAASQ